MCSDRGGVVDCMWDADASSSTSVYEATSLTGSTTSAYDSSGPTDQVIMKQPDLHQVPLDLPYLERR